MADFSYCIQKKISRIPNQCYHSLKQSEEEDGVNPSRASELVPALEQDIVTGKLKPGQKLDEAMLAKRFNVSRTPVREALGKLAASGLVDIRPRRSAVVATISLRELMNMFEMMANLEGICARYAARRITPEEKLELIAAQKACTALDLFLMRVNRYLYAFL